MNSIEKLDKKGVYEAENRTEEELRSKEEEKEG